LPLTNNVNADIVDPENPTTVASNHEQPKLAIMRKTIVVFAAVSIACQLSLYAQGTVQFFNSALSKLKYQDVAGAPLVDMPVGVVVGLYWGTSPDSLHLEPRPWTIVTPGLFGTSQATGVYPLTGSNPGEVVSIQIRAWYNKGGVTPLMADQGPSTPGITHYAQSETVTTTALGPTAGPGTVIIQGATGTHPNRIRPFAILVPEPSTWALLALGLGAICLRRRRPASNR
jgi:hypothetical protein